MISILIPVYNYDITLLVDCLHSAIEDSDIYSEIIIGADGCDSSSISTYSKLAKLNKVKLYVAKKNIGRAAIRNELFRVSEGDHLLYIDADALVGTNAGSYLNEYIKYLNSAPLICGGVLYYDIPPSDPDKYLRWRYGRYREMKSAVIRNKNPYASFSGFNFLVSRNILEEIKFNEELVKYGHEDTLFGFQLSNAKIPLIHIDNALIHDGLEPNRIFLQKSQEGISNLNLLYNQVEDKSSFARIVKLIRVYRILSNFGLNKLLNHIFKKRRRKLEIILRSGKTPLRIFDFYKLALFSHLRKEEQST